MKIYRDKNGDLVFDYLPGAGQHGEKTVTVGAADVPKLVEALGGSQDEDAVTVAAGPHNAFGPWNDLELKEWLRDKRIRYNSWYWRD